MVDAVVAVVGVAIAWALWRGTTDRPALEPASSCGSGTGTTSMTPSSAGRARPWPASATVVVDGRIIDGAVNGVAAAGQGDRRRRPARLQTGYVRNYALGIALGLAAIIAFMISRVWWS